jgi:cell division protein FtsW
MQQKENLTPDKKTGIWGLVDRIEGDKVVWIITFVLIMISWLAIFSSTSLMAIHTGSDRLAIMKEQVIITAMGLGIILLLYNFKRIGVIRWGSKFGFPLSFALLLILLCKKDFGPIDVEVINGAARNVKIFGYQIHIFEIVKVAMMMYIAWAIHTCKKDEEEGSKSKYFKLVNKLSQYNGLEFLSKPFSKRAIYIYIPMITVFLMVLPGSNSSALLIGGIMGLTLLIGGIKIKELVGLAILGICAFGIAYGIYKISDGEIFSRLSVFEKRISMNKDPRQLLVLKGQQKRDLLDVILQPNTARIAVHEGGFLGKGPGGSTQKYIVPLMFGDYMYAFILEEYGLWGGILIIILYVSLLARGIWIAKLCDSRFAQIAVGGLTLLITSQAFLHMFINVDLGPLTGQTLPLVSHGNGAFLSFCVAFGVILSISRMANKKIREKEEEAKPFYEKEDDIQASLDVLEGLDNIDLEQE